MIGGGSTWGVILRQKARRSVEHDYFPEPCGMTSDRVLLLGQRVVSWFSLHRADLIQTAEEMADQRE